MQPLKLTLPGATYRQLQPCCQTQSSTRASGRCAESHRQQRGVVSAEVDRHVTGCIHDHAQRAQRHVNVWLPLVTTDTISAQPQRGQSGVRDSTFAASGFGISRTGALSDSPTRLSGFRSGGVGVHRPRPAQSKREASSRGLCDLLAQAHPSARALMIPRPQTRHACLGRPHPSGVFLERLSRAGCDGKRPARSIQDGPMCQLILSVPFVKTTRKGSRLFVTTSG